MSSAVGCLRGLGGGVFLAFGLSLAMRLRNPDFLVLDGGVCIGGGAG